MGSHEHREALSSILTQLADLVAATSAVPIPIPSAGPSGQGRATTLSIRGESSVTPTSSRPRDAGSVGLRSEMSNLFAPYPRPVRDGNVLRPAGRPARQRPSLTRPLREWTGRFCCLGSNQDDKTPNDSRMLVLKRNGLGDGVITCGYTSSSADLHAGLVLAFPKLNGMDYELCRALTGGKGKPVVRISNTEQQPNVAYLRASRASMIYIRPMRDILMDNTEEVTLFEESREDEVIQPEVVTLDTPNENSIISAPDQSLVAVPDTIPLTISDFRNQHNRLNEGYQYICISRDRMLEKILGIYKDPNINLFKTPKVEFQGEAGSDIGALTKEYFWKGLLALIHDKLDGKPLFEEETDHKLPSTDSAFLRAGVFKSVGKFISHAIIHCGFGFIGLAEAACEYLTVDEVDSDTPFTLTIDDVPDSKIRDALVQISKVKSGATLSSEELASVESACSDCNYNETVTEINATNAYDQILYYTVVERRTGQLGCIKSALRSVGLVNFLKDKLYLVAAAFPRNQSITYPSRLVIEKIKCEGSPEKFPVVTNYIQSLENIPEGLQNLLSSWTGWPILPEDPRIVRFEDDADFEVHTCFSEIVIPNDLSESQILTKLNLLVNYGSGGFGTV